MDEHRKGFSGENLSPSIGVMMGDHDTPLSSPFVQADEQVETPKEAVEPLEDVSEEAEEEEEDNSEDDEEYEEDEEEEEDDGA